MRSLKAGVDSEGDIFGAVVRLDWIDDEEEGINLFLGVRVLMLDINSYEPVGGEI